MLVIAVFGSPDVDRRWAIVRDAAELPFTIIVMALVTLLALAPVVSMIAFEDVGRTVLGSAAVPVLLMRMTAPLPAPTEATR